MSVQVEEFATIDPDSLTEKQAAVLKALQDGKSVNQIARKMKITPPGVYAHIRALTKRAERSANGSAPDQVVSSNGGHSNGAERSEPAIAGGFEVAVETLQQSLLTEQEILAASEGRITEAQTLITEAQAAIAAESDEIARRAARIEALETASSTLTAAAV